MSAGSQQKTRYRLVSLGRLKPGTDETEAIRKLQAITKLDAAMVRKKLLASKKASLLTTSDVTRLASLKGKFAATGLMVEVAEIPPETTPSKPKSSKAVKNSGAGWLKRIAISVTVLLVIGVGLGTAGWFWLFKPLDDQTLSVEAALVNDRTAAIAHINLEQINKLLLLSRTNLADLTADPTDTVPPFIDILSDNNLGLTQAFAAVLANPNAQRPDMLIAITGAYSAAGMKESLSRHYAVVATDDSGGLVQLTPRLQSRSIDASVSCPSEPVNSPSRFFASLADNRVILSDSLESLQRGMNSLGSSSSTPALTQWQAYRHTKLASVMVFSPKDGSAALPGMAGMIGSQVIASLPNLSNAAFSADVDLLARGVRLNGQLGSTDANWNREIASTAINWLNTTKDNTRITSPIAADLMSAMAVTHDTQTVSVDWPITLGMVTQLRQSIENTLASAFGGSLSVDGNDEEQIVDEPADYQASFQLANLPPFDINEAMAAPAFVDGPMAVDFDSLTMNDNGLLEMTLKAEAALPDGIEDSTLRALIRQSLQITSVQDQNGNALLRDELCLDVQNIYGGKNHEAATQGSVFFQKASINKRVRLMPAVNVADIHQIDVTYTLTRPTSVQTFNLPLQAGEQVQYGGVSIDLISIGDRSVRFRRTGPENRLLDVRARNAAGQVLQSSWSSSFGRVKDQHYRGQIHSLEVIIAADIESRTTTASLTGLFEPDLDNETPASPFALSYAVVDDAKWNRYQFVDMRLLRPLTGDWPRLFEDERTVGQNTWPGMKLVVTHSESGWSGNPTAHFYMPLFKELTGSMSALSYQLPDAENPIERFVIPSFPYNPADLTLIPLREIQGQSFGVTNFTLDTGDDAGSAFDGINGILTLRMPKKLSNTTLTLTDLWQGQTIEGVRVTLEAVNRGMFPGYQLKLAGQLDNLIAIHGLDEFGRRVSPITQNFQNAGYWTATIPFRNNMTTVQLVTAERQAVFELPFTF